MSTLTRRDFLSTVGLTTVSGSVLGGAVLTGCEPAADVDGPANPDGASVRAYDLSAGWLDATFPDPDDPSRQIAARLRSYNGQIPGPVLEVRPGDRLRVRLNNALTPYDSSAWNGDHNVPHHLGTTNLHLHGLEIVPHLFEPVGTSDPTAEMIAVGPGETYDYEFEVPDDQPDGLFWYHPHHHGSTVVQAVTGMAGGLIVHGPIDEVPEIQAARDIVVVFNDIGLFPSEDDPDVWTYEPRQNAIWNTLSSEVLLWDPQVRQMKPAPELRGGFTTGDYKLRYYLVNGQPVYAERHNDASAEGYTPPPGCPSTLSPQQDPIGTQFDVPIFELRPGEVVRFRMVNANSDDVMPIVVDGHALHLIALDGVNFPAPRVLPEAQGSAYGDEQVLLAPANRAEFLLQAGEPGTYQIRQLGQCEQFLYSAERVLATIVVAGAPIEPPMALPTDLPIPTRHYPLIDPTEIRRRRAVTFSMGLPTRLGTSAAAETWMLNAIVGLDFRINNVLYDEASVSAVVKRGSAEEWLLSVPNAANGGSEGHPFHVHVNSFELISITRNVSTDSPTYEELPPGTIMDTIWVPADSEVLIRMKFREWTGKAVYHCHILPHEDTGMMQNFLISP